MNTTYAPRPSSVMTLLVLACFLVLPASAQPTAPMDTDLDVLEQVEGTLGDARTRATLSEDAWDAYGQRIEAALASGHDGLEQGAMRLVIQYGQQFDLNRAAIFNLVRLYRDHDNERVRRMAVVALGQTGDHWAQDFLNRSARFERNEAVRHTIRSVIALKNGTPMGPSKTGG